jgi:hypothetical protein
MTTGLLKFFAIDHAHTDRVVPESLPEDRVGELLNRFQVDPFLLPFVIRHARGASPKLVVDATQSAFKTYAKATRPGPFVGAKALKGTRYVGAKGPYTLSSDVGASVKLLSEIKEDVVVVWTEQIEGPIVPTHHFERWIARLQSRVKATEAAETRLWETVLEEIAGLPIDDTNELTGEALAFQRAVQRRDDLIANEKWFSSEQIAQQARGAVVESNKDQYAYQLRQSGQILGVRHARKRLHPACQFHEVNGRLEPLPVMKRLLELLPKDDTGWDQAFWLFQPTGRLDGQRPADVLATRPDDVLTAAEKDFHGDAGI